MRILSPIAEESEPATTTTAATAANAGGGGEAPAYDNYEFNRSILTVISEMLGSTSAASASEHKSRLPPPPPPAPPYQSSLVHTIDELRNNSLCNLFFHNNSGSSSADLTSDSQPAPQVPPRTTSAAPKKQKAEAPLPSGTYLNVPNSFSSPVKSIKSNTLVPSPHKEVEEPEPAPPMPRKSPLLTSAGSRKNILQLAEGGTGDILNTPNKSPMQEQPLALPQPNKVNCPLHSGIAASNQSSMLLRAALSPSSKYETPTPPLRPNQFVRNSNLNRPRRKFSLIRDRFEDQPQGQAIPTSIDLYQNISDSDLLHNDLSHISGANLPPACSLSGASTPSFVDSKDFELRPDQKYDSSRRRGGWATSSSRFGDNHGGLNAPGNR